MHTPTQAVTPSGSGAATVSGLIQAIEVYRGQASIRFAATSKALLTAKIQEGLAAAVTWDLEHITSLDLLAIQHESGTWLLGTMPALDIPALVVWEIAATPQAPNEDDYVWDEARQEWEYTLGGGPWRVKKTIVYRDDTGAFDPHTITGQTDAQITNAFTLNTDYVPGQ